MDMAEYRTWLIKQIIKWDFECVYTEEVLRKKPTRTLEKIFDNVG